MNRFFLIIVLFVFTCSQAHAQTKKESIKTLFVIMQQDSLISKSFKVMTSSIISSMTSQMQSDTSLAAKMSKMMEKSMEFSKKFAMKLLNEDMVDIYDKYFTQQEIDDFIVFYKSKSGQKMINMIPEIQKDIMAAMSAKYTPTLQEEIMKEFNQIIKETSGGN